MSNAETSTSPPLVIFGCGYVGSRLARVALAAGRRVRVCARSVARLAPLADLGAEVRFIDAGRVKQFGPALQGLACSSIVYSIPPLPNVPAGEAMRRATQAARNAGAGCFIYLCSAGVYGDRPDAEWVDEGTAVAHDDMAMRGWLQDEQAVEAAGLGGLRTVTLRLAAIYGPGRGVRQRLRRGDYRLTDDGQHYISRVHVDDIVRAILAAEEKASPGSLYLVADDRPTTQREYAAWLCQRLGLPLPPSMPSYAPGAPRTHLRGRRVRNDKLRRELSFELAYPSFVEGELQIERAEGGSGEAVPQAPTEGAPPVVAQNRALPAAAAPGAADARPPLLRAAACLDAATDTVAGDGEEALVRQAPLGELLGLRRLDARLLILPPGRRSGWPHRHSAAEGLVYVLDGTPDAWIDGRLHRLAAGDAVTRPPGSDIAFAMINNSEGDVRLLVVGEKAAGKGNG